jgi:hypothetical protein
MPRHVVNAAGETAGLEVWTGEGWLELVGVAMVTTSHPAQAPVLGQATVTFARVLPPGRAPVAR